MHSYHLQAKGFEVSACIVMEVDLVAHSQAVDDLPDSDPSSFSPNFNWPNGDLGVAGETKRKSNHSPHCLTDSFYMLQLDGWWLQFKSLKQIVYQRISCEFIWCIVCFVPLFRALSELSTIRRALKWPEPTWGAQQVEALRHLLA